MLAGDVAATLLVFTIGSFYRNASFYDAYWSVAPLPIAIGFLLFEGHAPDPRMYLVLCGLTIWGVRLTWNWGRGWSSLDHEDWRYVDLREEHGRLYPLVNLFGIHLFPTALVFAGLIPVYFVASQPSTLSPIDALAVVVTALGIGCEAVADQQLRSFVKSKPAPSVILQSGLWGWSRHPNYFGEICFWVGVWLFGVAAGAPAWACAGMLSMLFLFLFISIPMIEKRMVAKRPDYAEVQQRIPMLVPRPPRRS